MCIEKHEKKKRSFSYSQVGQIIHEELTFEKFVSGLQNGYEYFFTCKHHTIDIAFHFEGNTKIYEANVDGYDIHARCFTFSSVEELIDSKILEDKNLRELWCNLET